MTSVMDQGVCSAIGASMILHSSVTSVTTWFFNRRALAVGIAVSGSSLGGVIFPILVYKLIKEIGFSWAIRTCAFMILALMAIAVVCVRSHLQPKPKAFKVKHFVTPFKEFAFSSLMLYVLFFYIGLLLPLTYIVVMATEYGVDTSLAFYMLPILNAASFLGRIISGYAADKLGRFNVLIFLSFATGIIDLALWIPARSTAPILVFTFLFGWGSGAFVAITPTLVAHISDISEIGVRIGTQYFMASIAALISAPVGGALIQRDHGGFTGLQIYCGVCQLLGACALLATRLSFGGLSFKRKI